MWRVLIVDRSVTAVLRRSQLRPHLPADQPLPGDDRPDAVHFAALAAHPEPGDDGRPTSTCFVLRDPPPWDPADVGAWHLRQMATDPKWRHQGAGAAVVAALVGYVAARGGGRLWCNARTVAEGFYARTGFATVSDVHPSGNPPIPHVYMERIVAAAALQPGGGSDSSEQ